MYYYRAERKSLYVISFLHLLILPDHAWLLNVLQKHFLSSVFLPMLTNAVIARMIIRDNFADTQWYHSAYSCKKQVYLGGRLDHRQDVPRHLEELEELVVPFESLEVHEHGARGVGDVGDVGSVQSSVL